MKAFITRRRVLAITLIPSLCLLCGIKLITSLAQTSSQENDDLPAWKVKKVEGKRLRKESKQPDDAVVTERVIEDHIPEHLPIKVELNNLQKKPLLRNLEVKVTNTSNKPIYHLVLGVILPEIISPHGEPMGFPLRYGRMDLISFQEPIRSDDLPIQPGESFTFKIPEENLQSLEQLDTRKNLGLKKLRKLYLMFQLLNFGDKTGFSGTNG
jgi:hypothetical protein